MSDDEDKNLPEGMSAHWIPDSNLPKLLDKLAKLSAKAASLGAPPIIVEVTDDKKVEKKDKDSASGIVYTKIIVGGTAPRFSGYQFLAKVEHTKSGNILYVTPGLTVPESFRYTDNHCDHCDTKRKRNLTYLVRHDGDGKVLQVGSNCLADFLGHRSPEQIAWLAQFITELDDTINGFRGGGEELIDLDKVLTMSACVMRHHGWVSSKLAMEMARRKEDGEDVRVPQSTSSRVTTQLWPPTDKANRAEFEAKERLWPEKQDEELAQTAKQWAATLVPNGEYLHNLHVIAQEKYLKPKAFGLAVSLVMAYKRSLESDAEREAKKKARETEKEKKIATSQHVGAVGERRDFKLFVEKVIPKESDYGMTYITKMVDGAGNVFTWFASGTNLDEGKWYEMKATIKGHDEYQGVKQTVITRAKVKEEPIDHEKDDPNAFMHDQWGYRVEYKRGGREVRLKDTAGNEVQDILEGSNWVRKKSENPPVGDLEAEVDLVDLRQI